MTYVKLNGNLYPAEIEGKITDTNWDNRSSKAITLEMDYDTALSIFVDGLAWSIVMKTPDYIEENGEVKEVTRTEEYDNADYCVAGSITDNRDGTMTVKMGKLTELEEAYEIMLGGIE